MQPVKMGLLALILVTLALSTQLAVGKITWIEARHPIGGTPAPPGSPWPYPQFINTTHQQLTLDPKTFEMFSNADQCDIIKKSMNRYRKLVFILGDKGKADANKRRLKSLDIMVKQYTGADCKYPKLEEDESYKLEVRSSDTTARLEANTVWGALRGLETFSQLVHVAEKNSTYLINITKIEDKPTFAYRGILLDSARHYQPIKILKQNLDAMSYNKFNVFHWHLVDDQSWPLESKTFPNLTTLGAYHPRLIYTQDDVREIIEYARLRGIRVLPEFDTPGHTRALGNSFPEIITPCYGDGKTPFTPNYTEHSDREILNPMENSTYTIVKEIVKEFKGLFPDEYIHLGMDEVYYGCWQSNPILKKFMTANNLKTINDLESYYVKKTVDNVKSLGYKYMMWQDPIDNNVVVANDTIVQIWKDTSLDSKLGAWHDYIRDIAKKGYKMVVSACWYLNYISYGMDWKKYYDCDPKGFQGTDDVKKLVIGGEACMWGEYVDGTNLIARLWPRASAVAERLWSSAKMNNTDEAQYRLDEQRCRMLRRGLPTQAILNGYCGDYEFDLDAKWSTD